MAENPYLAPISRAFRFLWGSDQKSKPETLPDVKRNLAASITPYQLERIRQDIATWREAINEAENAWYPHRVRIQRLFQDTVLNWQVYACMERRKDLTRLREFCIEVNGEESEEWTAYFKSPWFKFWMDYGLDAKAYGYSLVAMGDMVNNQFPNLTLIKRQNVSPDRFVVGTWVYAIQGFPFTEDPYVDWHTYFTTPSENGASPCGYGYLYRVALVEIYMRNNIGANADYVQTYGQPFRWGKTSKTEEDERAEMAQMLQSMGVSNWAVTDPDDEIEFIEAKGSGSGNGYQSYDNMESRMMKGASKIILGHADAIDSTPGKLGSDNGDDNPVAQALKGKRAEDGEYIEHMVNSDLIVKLQKMGILIPSGAKFRFKNDEEEEEAKKKEDETAQAAAMIMKTISDAGGRPDWKWYNERTGMNIEEKIEAEPEPNDEIMKDSKTLSSRIQNKLDSIYGVIK